MATVRYKTQSCKLSSGGGLLSGLTGQQASAVSILQLACLVSLTNHNPSTSYNLTSIDQFSFARARPDRPRYH